MTLAPPTPAQVELRDKDIEWENFSDGFPNIFIRLPEKKPGRCRRVGKGPLTHPMSLSRDRNVRLMAGREVIFLANFFPATGIFEQLSLLAMLPR
jgi:hypothetical protein